MISGFEHGWTIFAMMICTIKMTSLDRVNSRTAVRILPEAKKAFVVARCVTKSDQFIDPFLEYSGRDVCHSRLLLIGISLHVGLCLHPFRRWAAWPHGFGSMFAPSSACSESVGSDFVVAFDMIEINSKAAITAIKAGISFTPTMAWPAHMKVTMASKCLGSIFKVISLVCCESKCDAKKGPDRKSCVHQMSWCPHRCRHARRS